MKGLLREYALVGLVIVMGIAGYLYVYQNQEDVLASSMDLIGDRLVEMVDDAGSKAFIRDRFAQFKERVMNREIAPDQIENVAANVLNLSNSGSTLTPEQAEMMLQFAAAGPEVALLPEPDLSGAEPEEPTPETAPEAPLPAIRAPAPPPPPVAPEALTTLGERLHVMLAFNREVQAAVARNSDERAALAEHVRFQFENGLHLNVDSSLAATLSKEDFKRVQRELKRLEKQRMVVWKRNVAEALHSEREQARRELQAVETLRSRPAAAPTVRTRPEREVQVALKTLESLKELELKGYRTSIRSDSLRALFEHHFAINLDQALASGVSVVVGADAARGTGAVVTLSDSAVEVQVEAVADYLDDLADLLEDEADVREEALEDQIDALEDALDDLQDRRDEAERNEERTALDAAIAKIQRRLDALRQQKP